MKITSNIHIVDGIIPPPSGWKFLHPSPPHTTTKFHHARYSIYNSIVIVDDAGLTLFDAGTPESFPRFKECIEGLGYKLEDIKNIIISHGHVDHMGEMKLFVDISKARVYAHVEDAPYVEKKILGRRDFDAAKWMYFFRTTMSCLSWEALK